MNADRDRIERAYQECRSELMERQLSNSENLDRFILILSTGAFGLTLVFTENLFLGSEPKLSWLIVGAWSGFAIAIVSTLASFHAAQKSIKTQIDYAEKYYLDGDDSYLKKQNIFLRLTEYLEYASTLSFAVAMILLVFFASINMI